jgi:putative membrane protein insertion efficiency factor
MKWVAVKLVELYKHWISPALPPSCRFVPTCSEYAMEALDGHGIVRGTGLALLRIARCNPLGGSGYDPVPASAPKGATATQVGNPEQALSPRMEKSRHIGTVRESYQGYQEIVHTGAASDRRCCSTSN